MKNRDMQGTPGIPAEGAFGEAPLAPLAALAPDSPPHATAVLGVGIVVKVAYHSGPPELTFHGRLWYRGAAQEVSEADWLAMQARQDFPIHEFRTA